MQLDLFKDYYRKKLLHDLFIAYYDTRRNKRNTMSALNFELDYERRLFQLHEEILSGRYKIRPSICFINKTPVKREVFAADFRDRVIHHLVYNYISPVFEKTFIYDTYSCRKDKGTHFGIKRLNHFIRSCSQNYRYDSYILKMDIKGYFMAIDRDLLYRFISAELTKQSHIVDFDLDMVMKLIEQVIFNDPTQNYILKGSKADWIDLPASKSLFHSGPNKGLPIGNLTSQLFSNIYLNGFDHYVKGTLGINHYGRYVDDFVIIHQERYYLQSIIPKIRDYLKNKLHLELHPKKIYLQHFSKGVRFLGAVIKPHRIYIANRTKGNFYRAIEKHNKIVRAGKPTKEDKEAFLSSMNSYLGIMKHYRTYNIRKKMIRKNLSAWWCNYFYAAGYDKFVYKKRVVSN